MRRKMNLLEKKYVKEILEEELGVADKVSEISDEIFRRITDGKETDGVVSSVDDGLVFKVSQHGISIYSYEKNCIFINKNDFPDLWMLKDDIYHEVCHYWQCKHRGKTFDSSEYSVAANGICDRFENHYYRTACYIWYFSRRFKIDAFCNGAYGYSFSKNVYGDFNDFINNGNLKPLYKLYQDLFTTMDSLNMKDDYTRSHIEKFFNNMGIHTNDMVGWLDKSLEKGYKYFIRKAARIYTLLKIRTKVTDFPVRNIGDMDEQK